MKLLRLLSNLGYGSRRDVLALFREGRVCNTLGESLYADDAIDPQQVRVDGEPLDPPHGFCLMLHKPAGYTCSHKDRGRLVYELLPPRFASRKPLLSSVGRLDRETSGLLLFTDDGQLLHRIVAPKSRLGKVYEAHLAEPLRGDEMAIFASGTLMLDGEDRPLLPVQMQTIADRHVRLSSHEGRYHQVRRMFAAVGNHVEALHRTQIGGLALGDLASGAWRLLDAQDLERLMSAAPDAA